MWEKKMATLTFQVVALCITLNDTCSKRVTPEWQVNNCMPLRWGLSNDDGISKYALYTVFNEKRQSTNFCMLGTSVFQFDTFLWYPLWNKDVKRPHSKSCGSQHTFYHGDWILHFSPQLLTCSCLAVYFSGTYAHSRFWKMIVLSKTVFLEWHPHCISCWRYTCKRQWFFTAL